MKTIKEFYDNLDTAQLEEHIEIVEWDRVPSHLITLELKIKFPSFIEKITKGQSANITKKELKKELLRDKERSIAGNHLKMMERFKNRNRKKCN